MSRLLTNKYLLIGLGIIAIIGLLYIAYTATQNRSTPTNTSSQATFQPKTATLPPPVKDTPVSGQIIVKFKPQYTDIQINKHLQQYNASIIKTIEGINLKVVKVPAGQEQTILEKLQNDPYVEQVQRDYTTHAFMTPNDPLFSLQYALDNTGQSILGQAGKTGADMNIEQAWDVTEGDGVKVAILDTGINLNHPDLAGKVVLQKSFVSNTVEDGNGHGTHVAGILAADTNNQAGIAGACPGCQLIIGKVLDDTGSGTTSNATAGITWAADNGAKVISMSLGTTDSSTATLYDQAVTYAMSKGAVVVAAAGNDGTNQLNYPAAATGVISVAATNNQDQKASYSNYGSYVQIAAPGDNILSTGPTHSFELEPFGYNVSAPYMYLSGTSMATPYVAGIAALVSTTQYGTTPQDIANRLYSTADKIAGSGTYWNSGRIDAALAVGTPPTTTSGQQPSEITPTVYCVGGNQQPPCATVPPEGVTTAPPQTGTGPSIAVGSPAEGSSGGTNPSVSPSVSASPVPSPSGTPTTSAPACLQVQSVFYNLASHQPQTQSNKIHIKCAPSGGGGGGGGNSNPNNGWLSQFFQFLLELLQLLLQLISNCAGIPSTGTPAPSIAPISPSVALPSISTAISPSIKISTAPSISLTPSGVSPSAGGGGSGGGSAASIGNAKNLRR